MNPAVQPRGRYPSVLWVQRLEAGAAEGQVSRWCVDLVLSRAVAWHSLRVREPGRMEQQLCRPMGQGFSRPAVLLLDHGMEKPSMI
jgi:hypothetical protein